MNINVKSVIIVGNIIEGFSFVGPFENFDEADVYTEKMPSMSGRETFIATIEVPMQHYAVTIRVAGDGEEWFDRLEWYEADDPEHAHEQATQGLTSGESIIKVAAIYPKEDA